MHDESQHALSEVLDHLESSAHEDGVTVEAVIEKLGHKSFAALMLIFSLIAASPASAIPGITATVGVILSVLAVQMIFGRKCLWLPDFILRRRMPADKLRKGIRWLRKPVHFVERFLQERFTFLLHRPWLLLPLVLVLALALFMPFMEVIPTSGSIASAVIALFAAALLTRDGGLVIVSFVVLLALPVAAWHFGMGG